MKLEFRVRFKKKNTDSKFHENLCMGTELFREIKLIIALRKLRTRLKKGTEILRNVKGKSFLCTSWRNVGGEELKILDLGRRWRWVVRFTLRPIYVEENDPHLVWPQIFRRQYPNIKLNQTSSRVSLVEAWETLKIFLVCLPFMHVIQNAHYNTQPHSLEHTIWFPA